MALSTGWPTAELIETPRLDLEPLRVEHAEEVAPVLWDENLHRYTGGRPATVELLRARYLLQVLGRSPDGTRGWLNWVARHRESGGVVGTVQATVQPVGGRLHADLAWVIATAHQRKGFAGEAAAGMAGWLRRHGTDALAAYIHPEHEASIGVARRLGLSATGIVVNGEIYWTT